VLKIKNNYYWLFPVIDTITGKKPVVFILGCSVGFNNIISNKSGWRIGHQSRLPPLPQMLYVD